MKAHTRIEIAISAVAYIFETDWRSFAGNHKDKRDRSVTGALVGTLRQVMGMPFSAIVEHLPFLGSHNIDGALDRYNKLYADDLAYADKITAVHAIAQIELKRHLEVTP